LKLPRIGRELATFATIGVVSTAAYSVLYLVLRTSLSAELANALALLTTAIGNTAANRRFTFGVRKRAGMGRDQLGGLLAFGVALSVTSVAVAGLHAVTATPSRAIELFVLIAANGLATILRFVILRTWIVRGRRPSHPTPHPREALS